MKHQAQTIALFLMGATSAVDLKSSFAKPSPIEAYPGHDHLRGRRDLQIGQPLDGESTNGESESTNNFRATYLARFQHLADPGCSGPNPTIQVFCHGDLVPVSISDQSINCAQVSDGEWSGIQCTNTCGGDDADSPPCTDVFLETDNVGDDVAFGEILFQCEGEEVEGVDAYLNFVGGELGECEEGSLTNGNFHVAQLGVYCEDTCCDEECDSSWPDDCPDQEEPVTQSVYTFDGKDFECGLGSDVDKISGKYTCLAGAKCEDGAACTVEFEDLVVESDYQKFHECIESLTDGVPVPPEPSKEDLISPAADGDYSATFQANWQLQLDPDVCGGDFASKRLNCTNGVIEMVGTMAENVKCNKIGDSVLECNDTSAENFVNDFSGVVFKCDSVNAIPEVEAQYLSANSICIPPTENKVEHLLQLGVVCEDTVNGEFTNFADFIFECGDNNSYEIIDGKYTCGAANILSNSETRPMDVVSIHTDSRWSQEKLDICYTFVGDPDAPDPTSPPTPCETGGSGVSIGSGSGGDCEPESGGTSFKPGEGTPGDTPDDTPAPTPMATIVMGTPPPVETVDPRTPSPTQPTCPEVDEDAACTDDANPVSCGDSNCAYNNLCEAEAAGFSESDCASFKEPSVYFVDYRAGFKRVVDPGCESPTYETLLVVCETGELTNIEVNSNAVSCTPPQDYEGRGEVSICQVDCDGDECDDLYIDRESIYLFGIWILNENHVEIKFRCESGEVDGVDAGYVISGTTDDGSGEGSCDGLGQGDGQNVLLAQLNVMCPTDNGDWAYVNDDAYSECYVGPIALEVNGNYTCLTGDFCGDDQCLVTYQDVQVDADHHRFQECIQSDTGAPAPLPSSQTETPELGQYTSQFQVGSEFWYDDSACSGAATGIKITCVDGTIVLKESDPDKNCQVVSDNEIECTETDFSVVNEAVDVAIYECTANNKVPATRVEYYSTEIACDSSSQEQASRYINMGVLCGEPGDEDFVSLDYFFECGKENDYTIRTDDARFSCYSRVQVPENSNNEVVDIPAVEAYTDYRYVFLSSDRCYSYKAPSAVTRKSITKSVKASGNDWFVFHGV